MLELEQVLGTFDAMKEVAERLSGGMGNQGQVVRVGNTVRRPAGRHSAAVAGLLEHLAARGFNGAPVVLGRDEEGRDVYEWIDGDVAVPPFPAWALSDRALISTARLIRRLHDALSPFEAPPETAWSSDLADPLGGSLICHNDVCPENVVFRDNEAIAILDFDFAAPGRPLWDLAMAARMWVPLLPPDEMETRAADLSAQRLARFVSGYGLPHSQHEEFVDAIIESQQVGTAFVRRRAKAAEPAFVEMWCQRGGAAGFGAVSDWMKSQRRAWSEALEV
ncbi:MAG TPA: phosphotransferase [Solirubrobacterales bacterium]|nr:phosphotransferase [Solirubrobacterales bacterium]